MFECASVRRELEAIGSEIWRLVALDKSDEPLRFNDIAVILVPSAAERYQALYGDPDGRIPATFQILTLTAWAPDDSQPVALKPGTAAARLADALGAEEKSAGESVVRKR